MLPPISAAGTQWRGLRRGGVDAAVVSVGDGVDASTQVDSNSAAADNPAAVKCYEGNNRAGGETLVVD